MLNFLKWLAELFSPKPNTPIESAVPTTPVPVQTSELVGSSHKDLSKWRPEWTDGILPLIMEHLPTLSKAKDITVIRPDYFQLSELRKALVWVELFKAMCKFESDFNPLSASVDVGEKDKRDTWSIGLLQLSVVDQANLGIKLGYTYEDLLKPLPNLKLAVRIMANQVNKRGLVMIDKDNKGNPGTYWAVIKLRGAYDKSAKIIGYVQAMTFQTATTPVVSVQPKDWFVSRLGWSENDPAQDKELAKGWPLTKHCKSYTSCKGNNRSWCGMSMACAMKAAGYKYPEQCETAFEWQYYGKAHDFKNNGIPENAVIVLKSSHVTLCNKAVPAGAKYVDCIGGNQGDKICVRTYAVSDILAVRIPVK